MLRRIMFLLALSAPLGAQNAIASAARATIAPMTVDSPKASATSASASRAAVAPVLDGKSNDVAWANAQVIDQFL